jgi:hypothetical protein
MPSKTRRGAIEAWTIHRLPRKAGTGGGHHHDAGYSAQASQVTVTLSIANHSTISHAALFPGLQRVGYGAGQTPSQARRRIIEVDRTI